MDYILLPIHSIYLFKAQTYLLNHGYPGKILFLIILDTRIINILKYLFIPQNMTKRFIVFNIIVLVIFFGFIEGCRRNDFCYRFFFKYLRSIKVGF